MLKPIFTPKIGELIQFEEHIFQMGWFNHQLVFHFHFFLRVPCWIPTTKTEFMCFVGSSNLIVCLGMNPKINTVFFKVLKKCRALYMPTVLIYECTWTASKNKLSPPYFRFDTDICGCIKTLLRASPFRSQEQENCLHNFSCHSMALYIEHDQMINDSCKL